MKKPSNWRVFRWNADTGDAYIEGRTTKWSTIGRQNKYVNHHVRPIELCMWEGKPIDDCPNIRRTEIDLYPEFKKPTEVTNAATVQNDQAQR